MSMTKSEKRWLKALISGVVATAAVSVWMLAAPPAHAGRCFSPNGNLCYKPAITKVVVDPEPVRTAHDIIQDAAMIVGAADIVARQGGHAVSGSGRSLARHGR